MMVPNCSLSYPYIPKAYSYQKPDNLLEKSKLYHGTSLQQLFTSIRVESS